MAETRTLLIQELIQAKVDDEEIEPIDKEHADMLKENYKLAETYSKMYQEMKSKVSLYDSQQASDTLLKDYQNLLSSRSKLAKDTEKFRSELLQNYKIENTDMNNINDDQVLLIWEKYHTDKELQDLKYDLEWKTNMRDNQSAYYEQYIASLQSQIED